MKRIKSLDVKYSLTQVLYFATFAGALGYATNYLTGKGLSTSIVGVALSIVSVLAVFTQPMIASFADSHKNIEIRYLVMLFIAIATVLAVVMSFMPSSAAMLTLVLFVSISTALQTVTPLLNSLAFVFKKYGVEINYGIGRGLGSAAYAFAALGIGKLANLFGTNFIPYTYIVLNILLIFVCYVYVIPKNEAHLVEVDTVAESAEGVKQLSFIEFFKKYKKYMLFILGVAVVYFTHTIINNFMIKVIEPIGGDSSTMGIAVFIAAMAELPAMFGFNKLREKIGCSNLLRIAAVMFLVKHVITYFAPNMTIMYVAQLTQALAYAPLIPAGVYYANQIISEADSVKGQSMFTMAMTASGIVANLVGGVLIDAMGAHSVLLIGIVVSIVGCFVLFAGLDDVK